MGQEVSTNLSQTNLPLYRNSTFGIEFQYPQNWNKIEIISEHLKVIEFYSAAENNLSKTASLLIAIENLPGNFTLGEYVLESEKLFDQMFPNVTLETPLNSQILGGLPAYEKVFTILEPLTKLNLKIKQIFTVHNDIAYVITYSSEESKYFKFLPIAQEIIRSFHIL